MRRRTRRLLLLVLLALAVLVILGWDQAQIATGWGLPQRSSEPMLIVAHRGNMAVWPEDTAEAIADAARLDADGIEIDVHESADGTWWVMHDATVDRTTDGSGAIANLSDTEMAALRIDAGPGYDEARDTNVHPPRLADALDDIAAYDGWLFIDLQHTIGGELEQLLGLLSGRRLTVICRNSGEVARVEAIDPAIVTLLRIDRVDDGMPLDMVFLEAVSEATVGRVAEQGLPVATYRDDRYAHLADEWVLRRAWAAGVDVYLTKEIERALAQRDALAMTTAP